MAAQVNPPVLLLQGGTHLYYLRAINQKSPLEKGRRRFIALAT